MYDSVKLQDVTWPVGEPIPGYTRIIGSLRTPANGRLARKYIGLSNHLVMNHVSYDDNSDVEPCVQLSAASTNVAATLQ